MKHETAQAAAQAEHDARVRKARRAALAQAGFRLVVKTGALLIFLGGLGALFAGIYMTAGIGWSLIIGGVIVMALMSR